MYRKANYATFFENLESLANYLENEQIVFSMSWKDYSV